MLDIIAGLAAGLPGKSGTVATIAVVLLRAVAALIIFAFRLF